MRPVVRRIRSHEGSRLRDLRLRALSDAPTAFGATYATEVAYPDEVWRSRAEGASAGCNRATFVAEQDGQWLGLVTGLRALNEAHALLVSMFVERAVRGMGVGDDLVRQVEHWARDCGATALTLLVTAGNDPAIALYRRCGFRMTGTTQPLGHTPTLTEHEMGLDLR